MTPQKNFYAIEMIKKMLETIGVPGIYYIEAIRAYPEYPHVGVGLLHNSVKGKVALIAKMPLKEAVLCTVTSESLSSRDLRLVISSRLTNNFFPTHQEEASTESPIQPSSFLEELNLLEKKFAADKSTFPIPACVKRLQNIRAFTARLDHQIKKVKLAKKRVTELEIKTLIASDRAHKAARRALDLAQGIHAL